ncbi:MAG: hypothetical protein WBF93_08780, partial [Pirellulales bacterium]
ARVPVLHLSHQSMADKALEGMRPKLAICIWRHLPIMNPAGVPRQTLHDELCTTNFARRILHDSGGKLATQWPTNGER